MNHHKIIGSVFENNTIGVHVTEGHSLVSIGNIYRNNGVGFSTENEATKNAIDTQKHKEFIEDLKSLNIPDNVPDELLIDLINKLKEKQNESIDVKEKEIERSGLLKYLPSMDAGIGIMNGLIELISKFR